VLLDGTLTAEELRGMLSLRRAEAHDRVVVKSTDPEWVVALAETVGSLDDIAHVHGRLWPRLHAIVQDLGIDRVPPSIAVERGSGPIEFTAALHVHDDVHCDDGARTYELAGLGRAATTVMYGDDFDGGFRALRAWIDEAGEQEAGELREIYLECDGPRGTWVVELQLALENRSVRSASTVTSSGEALYRRELLFGE
jgi:hypothetical protein